jgi:hypothetical protein
MPGLKNYRAFGQELKTGDFRHMEQIIQLLEDEEHRPGYAVFKQNIWSYLKKAHLNEPQKRRLRNAALGYLNRRMTRDFWAMAKFIGTIATAELGSRVQDLVQGSDRQIRTRAVPLSAYVEGRERGAPARQEIRSKVLEEKYKWQGNRKARKAGLEN